MSNVSTDELFAVCSKFIVYVSHYLFDYFSSYFVGFQMIDFS